MGIAEIEDAANSYCHNVTCLFTANGGHDLGSEIILVIYPQGGECTGVRVQYSLRICPVAWVPKV